MKHRKSGVKLSRTASHRQAMFRNMVTSLLKYDRIRTTDVKAKALRQWVDHVITLAKRGDLHARRQAMAIVREKEIVHKLFEEAGKRFGDLNGGYTRIVKIGRRPGDAAPISLVELVAAEDVQKKSKKKPKSTPKKKTKAAEPAAVAEKAEEQAAPEAAADQAQPEGEAEAEQTEQIAAGEAEIEEKAEQTESGSADTELKAADQAEPETEAPSPESQTEPEKKPE